MRLSTFEQKVIREATSLLDPQASVFLFGSRADPSKKGGDIDLLVISKVLGEKDKRILRWAIGDQIGEQRIDIVIAKDESDPFVRIALSKGIKL